MMQGGTRQNGGRGGNTSPMGVMSGWDQPTPKGILGGDPTPLRSELTWELSPLEPTMLIGRRTD